MDDRDYRCNKQYFANRKEARAVLRTADHPRYVSHAKLFPYHCPLCGGWHLTSQSRRSYQIRRRERRRQQAERRELEQALYGDE